MVKMHKLLIPEVILIDSEEPISPESLNSPKLALDKLCDDSVEKFQKCENIDESGIPVKIPKLELNEEIDLKEEFIGKYFGFLKVEFWSLRYASNSLQNFIIVNFVDLVNFVDFMILSNLSIIVN